METVWVLLRIFDGVFHYETFNTAQACIDELYTYIEAARQYMICVEARPL